MGKELIELGMQAAEGAVGAGLGMLVGGWQDKRQLKQQKKLQQLQLEGNKEMVDYNQAKQLEMWEKTNYVAQKEQMKKAGLNPALLYGMSGGGGATTGNPTGSVQGSTAAGGSGEPLNAIAMGLQLQTQRKQLDLMDAEADNLRAEAENKRGGERKLMEAQTTNLGAATEKLIQDTDNARLQWNLMNVDLGLKRIEERVKGETIEAAIQTSKSEADKMVAEAKSAMIKAKVDENTQLSVESEIRARAALTWAQEELAKSNIKLNEEQIEKIWQEIDHMMHDTVQGYNENILQQRMVDIMHYNAKIDAAFKPMKAMTDVAGGVLQILTLDKLLEGRKQRPQEVKGFGRGNKQ